ncbi:hypothetical protein NCCP2331_16190 [Sporosarcina sp. NCCP-2331]|nr:hypothetical protein NCCP2331_16190 [Sporosarcina sp. NCCP-2331]GLB55590.1 hypothetical protein NCCP2378_13770 [Sporosarcina sp. NCCP-2378]
MTDDVFNILVQFVKIVEIKKEPLDTDAERAAIDSFSRNTQP